MTPKALEQLQQEASEAYLQAQRKQYDGDLSEYELGFIAGRQSGEQEWISVEDKKPEYIDPSIVERKNAGDMEVRFYNNPNGYLVYTSLGVHEIADLEKDGTFDFDQREGEQVTHYQPLQPPKIDK